MKRAFDLVVATSVLIVASPLLTLAALAVKIQDGGPIIYRGERVGLDGRRFQMLKFRTMVPDAMRRGGTSTAGDDPRLTAVGRWLRRFKFDELPQLVNVLRGEMSLVGPRPQVPWAVALYTPAERALLSVRPGLSDYASIRFRNESEILRGSQDPDRDYLEKIAPEKIRLGLEYVRKQSMTTDARIILATLWTIAGGKAETILGHQS